MSVPFQQWLAQRPASDRRGFYELWEAWWQEHGEHSRGRSRIARQRRGRYVLIPPEWRGKVTYRPTIHRRLSKGTRKLRNRRWSRHGDIRARQEALAPKVGEWDG